MKKIMTLIIVQLAASVAFAQNSELVIHQDCENGIEQKSPYDGHTYTYVDLGLPSGIKWATCNVGADNPWDFGGYFAWGETVPYGKSDVSNAHNHDYTGNTSYVKTYFDMETYKYSTICNNVWCLTKYNSDKDYGTVVDNKTTLDLEDDAAHVNMGGSWRMPTINEYDELIQYGCWVWTNNYNKTGVAGCIVYKAKNDLDKGAENGFHKYLIGSYSLSDVHVFFPAAGLFRGSILDFSNSSCFYWSSSVSNRSGSGFASYLEVYDSDMLNGVRKGGFSYSFGMSVRGVKK